MDPRPSRRADCCVVESNNERVGSQWILGRVVALTMLASLSTHLSHRSQWILGRVVALTRGGCHFTARRNAGLNGSSAESSR